MNRRLVSKKEDLMMKISAFTKQHSLLIYLALTFVISWGGILLVVGRGGFAVNGEQSERLFTWMYLAMLAGPSIAGIVLTRVVYGRAGLRELASGLLRWQVGARWYAAALLIAPLAITVVLLTLSRISPEFLPRLLISDDKGFLLQFSFAAGLLVGIFEELGWTGFAVHTMLKRGRDILSTGLIVGLLFGAWNLLVVFLMSGTPSGAGGLSLVIFLPATLLTWLPTYRVLMVWAYDRTGSLLLAMLMYASLIAFWVILTPLALSGWTLVTYYLIFTAAMWIIIAVALRWQTMPRLQHA
jgi:membrane protease YdiL (CAAX protease family)